MNFKRIFDILASLLFIALTSPIFITVPVIIILSGSKPIYKSKRLGIDGKEFDCFKFTSMRDISSLHETSQKRLLNELHKNGHVKNDPRITWFGKIIRKSSIDELPQFFNVILGDMSLVGPRPISSYEIDKYGRSYSHYKKLKPGLTGIWQVSGRDNVKYHRRVAMDRYYSQKSCISLDFIILAKTPVTIMRMIGVN